MPSSIRPAHKRQTAKLKTTFQRAVTKAGRESVSSDAFKSATDFHNTEQDFGQNSFGDTLQRKPDDRDPQAVREALDWWLKTLPLSGCELAPELLAPDSVLYEAFRRGKFSTCVHNQIVLEEGEEAKHFTIILFGRCKLRCAKPKEDCEDTKGKTEEFLTLGMLGRGDFLPVFPGGNHVRCNIICSEKTSLLRLSAQDYESTFKPLHRDMFLETGQFLKRVYPDATDAQLHRLAPLLRQKRIARGKTFIHAGEEQRHIYFLKSGSCSVLVQDSLDVQTSVSLDEEGQDDIENDFDNHDKLQQLRASSYGARMQHANAFNEQRKEVLKGMARGPFRQALAGGYRHAFRVSDGDHASASLTEPGMMLGDESLVYDRFRDWANCRSCYTVRTTTDSQFYVADIFAYGQIASLMGSREHAHLVNDRLTRRCKQLARGKSVAKDLNKTVQELKASELARLSRQKLRLPRCAGYPAVDELENPDDYLDIIRDHRRAPANGTALPTLECLKGLPYDPNKKGPGVAALLKAEAEETDGRIRRRPRMALGIGASRDWFDDPLCYDANPMGSTVSANARYADVAPPMSSQVQLAIEDPRSALALTRCESSPQVVGTNGLFFHTEVDFDDGMSVRLEEKTLNTSVSLPSLPVAHSVASFDLNSFNKSEDLSILQKDSVKHAPPDHRSEARAAAKKRYQCVMKAFTKATSGKSILLLTDRKDLRKQITSILLKDDTSLRFLKTSNDLWPRLRDAKEQYHALLIDLSKNELPIEAILRTIRQDSRYGKLPIVVLSGDRILSEMVRASCSFVVFLPLAAAMLREALVWCFDRTSIEKLYKFDEEQMDLECVRSIASRGETRLAPPEIS